MTHSFDNFDETHSQSLHKDMYRRTVWVTVVATILVTFLIAVPGCTQDQESSGEEVIKIGAVLPLTGPAAFYGEWGRKGMELAEEEINNSGGVNGKEIDIVFEDSKNEPKTGVSAVNNMMNENMPVVISAMTGVSFSALPVVADAGKVMFMTIVTHPDAADRSKWAFRHYINKGKAARRMASYAYDSLGIEEAAILYINDEGGIGEKDAFVSTFEARGGTVVMEESFETQANSVRSQLLKIRQEDPEAVYFSGYGRIYGVGIREMRELDMDAQILASYEPLYESTQDLAGEALNGVIFTSPLFERSNEEAREFMNTYEDEYENTPELDAAFGYDVVQILSKALEQAGSEPRAIRDSLLTIDDHEGVLGEVTVQSNGDTQIPIVLRTVRDGEIVPVSNPH